MTKIKIAGQETGVDAAKLRDVLAKLVEDVDTFLLQDDSESVLDIIPSEPLAPQLNLDQEYGYLAPEVDPDTIPPHLLPYVMGIDLDDNVGKLAPGTDPSTIPREVLPYVRYISRRNSEINELKNSLRTTSLERDNLRRVILGIDDGSAQITIS